MPKNVLKILGIVIAAFILFGASAVFASDTTDSKAASSLIMSSSEHGCLSMRTWDASAFIPNTVSTGDTIVAAPFAIIIYEYAPYGCPAPGNTMNSMQAKLSYDDEHWRFIGAEKTSNWPNDFQWDTVDNVGNDYIRLYFTLGSGGQGVPTPTISKSYATLKFVSRCQPELSSSPIYTIWDSDHFNQVSIDGNTWWLTEAHSGPGGDISVKNYEATTTMGDQSISRLITEEPEIELPVIATTNFISRSRNFSINYNSAKLQFLELTDISDIFSLGCNPCPNPGDNPINFSLIDISQNNEMTDFQIFKLKFRVKAGWEKDTAQVNFNVSGCKIFTTICISDLSQPYAYHDGVVTVEPYHAQLRTTWDSTCSLLSKSGPIQTTYFWGEVQSETGFPTYHGAYAIGFNYLTGSKWSLISTESCPVGGVSLAFSRASVDDTSIVYQTNDAGITLSSTFVKVVRIGANYTPGYFTPKNYADRYVPLEIKASFQAGGNTYYSQVRDSTGTITATVPNGRLTLAGDGKAEVKIGLFHTPNVVSQNVSGTQPLYIRWNFADSITAFSVQVNCSRVMSVAPYLSGVQVSGGSGVFTVSYTASSPKIGRPVSGDSVRIATINYTVNCPYGKLVTAASQQYPGPQGPYYSSATVSLTNPSFTSTSGIQFAVTDTSTVTGLCSGFTPRDAEPIIDGPGDYKTAGLPTEYQLYQNHPNPFNPETIISYDVPKPTQVKIVVMNILGQEVATLLDESKSAGRYEIVWRGIDDNGSRVSSGIYLCVMRAGNFHSMVKMSLMK
jgi:hypothetical protein